MCRRFLSCDLRWMSSVFCGIYPVVVYSALNQLPERYFRCVRFFGRCSFSRLCFPMLLFLESGDNQLYRPTTI
jgi:hypothetical protein